MNNRAHLSLGFVFVLAVVLTALQAPIASAQGLTLTAAYVVGNLPTADPDSALWQQAVAIDVPLSAQNVSLPILMNTNVKSVTARALHNEKEIAFLVEWADATKDESMVRVQDFRDAVAVQFSLAKTAPYFCMGQIGSNVNIWHWKADWQADITARKDMDTQYPNMYVDMYPFADTTVGLKAGPASYQDANYLPALKAGNLFAVAAHTSPVEDITASGFGTLKAQPLAAQNVQGNGVWANGKWRVIFSRETYSRNPDDARFYSRVLYSIAFAAWDGSNGERNGQKSTSQWLALRLQDVPAPAATAPVARTIQAPDPSPILAVLLIPLGCIGVPFLGLLLLAAITQTGKKS